MQVFGLGGWGLDVHWHELALSAVPNSFCGVPHRIIIQFFSQYSQLHPTPCYGTCSAYIRHNVYSYNCVCTFITWQLLILLLFVFFLFFGPHYTITKSQWGEYWTFIDCRSTSSQREALRDWFRVSNSFSLFLFFWTTLHNYNVTRWLLNINRWWSTSSQREALWACFRVSTCTGTFTSHTYADATFLRPPPPPARYHSHIRHVYTRTLLGREHYHLSAQKWIIALLTNIHNINIILDIFIC